METYISYIIPFLIVVGKIILSAISAIVLFSIIKYFYDEHKKIWIISCIIFWSVIFLLFIFLVFIGFADGKEFYKNEHTKIIENL